MKVQDATTLPFGDNLLDDETGIEDVEVFNVAPSSDPAQAGTSFSQNAIFTYTVPEGSMLDLSATRFIFNARLDRRNAIGDAAVSYNVSNTGAAQNGNTSAIAPVILAPHAMWGQIQTQINGRSVNDGYANGLYPYGAFAQTVLYEERKAYQVSAADNDFWDIDNLYQNNDAPALPQLVSAAADNTTGVNIDWPGQIPIVPGSTLPSLQEQALFATTGRRDAISPNTALVPATTFTGMTLQPKSGLWRQKLCLPQRTQLMVTLTRSAPQFPVLGDGLTQPGAGGTSSSGTAPQIAIQPFSMLMRVKVLRLTSKALANQNVARIERGIPLKYSFPSLRINTANIPAATSNWNGIMFNGGIMPDMVMVMALPTVVFNRANLPSLLGSAYTAANPTLFPPVTPSAVAGADGRNQALLVAAQAAAPLGFTDPFGFLPMTDYPSPVQPQAQLQVVTGSGMRFPRDPLRTHQDAYESYLECTARGSEIEAKLSYSEWQKRPVYALRTRRNGASFYTHKTNEANTDSVSLNLYLQAPAPVGGVTLVAIGFGSSAIEFDSTNGIHLSGFNPS